MKSFKLQSRKHGKRKPVKLKMYGKTVTKQSFKDDCDINLIMAKFIKTGVLDHLREHGAEYGFASSDDFRASMEIISKAESMFEELPSQIRTQFDNDPATFLDFVQDENNIPKMQEMGLAIKTPKQPQPHSLDKKDGAAIDKPASAPASQGRSGTGSTGGDPPPPTQEPSGGTGSD